MLEILKKRWFLVALVSVAVLGYFVRGISGHFPKQWSLVALFLTMSFVGLGANLKALAESLLNWKASLLSLGMTYGLAPTAGFMIGWALFGRESELFKGCVLMGCAASTISSAIVYTRMSGGNHALSIVLSNLSNILSIMLTPAMLGLLLGGLGKEGANELPSDVILQMVLTLTIGVLLPIVLAQAICFVGPQKVIKFRPTASVLSQMGILTIVFGTICKTFAKADTQEGFYERLPQCGIQLVLASLVMYFVLVRLSYRLARAMGLSAPDSVAVSYASAQKTLAATIVLAERFFSPTAALPMIIYHLVQLLYGGYDGERLKRQVETSPARPN